MKVVLIYMLFVSAALQLMTVKYSKTQYHLLFCKTTEWFFLEMDFTQYTK